MTLSVRPFDAGFGAEIVGADLSSGVDEATRCALVDALLDHHVLAIRDQHLDARQTVAVSRCFGEVEPHVLDQYHHPDTELILVLSNRVDADGRPLGLRDAGSFWHSDVSFKPRPAAATLLYAIEVPEEGGDTLFCDMMAAYDALSPEMKRRLEGLHAVHDYAQRDRLLDRTGTTPQLRDDQRAGTPPVSHPVVRRHPISGRKAIYVNPTYTARIEGLDEAQSASLLETIFEHCLQERFRIRYRWRARDVLLWDNAAVMHAATTQELDPSRHRTLWRTIILGDAAPA